LPSVLLLLLLCFLSLLFTATAPTAIYTLSLHDALPISSAFGKILWGFPRRTGRATPSSTICCAAEITRGFCPSTSTTRRGSFRRSEEHTSELQSRENLVCRLLLEKKKKKNNNILQNAQT